MKLYRIIFVLFVGLLIVSFGNPDPSLNKKTVLITYCDSIPELNKMIIDFVKTRLNKKVGKGECWDLAAEALNSAGAKWNGQYVYGSVVHYQSDCVYPGDIMQFKGVRIKYQVNNRIYDETMDQHTAIIYEVKGKGDYILAHQNTAFSGRKVGLSELKLENITRGKFTIYRPVK
jgi:hypothetical protein